MGRRKAERPLRSRLPLLEAAVVVAAAVAVTTGVLAFLPSEERAAPEEPATTSRSPSPTASADLSGLPIARSLSCESLDDAEVATALGGQVGVRDSYGNGDRVELAPGVTDISHEYSCTFRSGDAEAAVWVFAAPVGTPDARRLVTEARRERGCEAVEGATQFGDPGLTTVCAARRGPTGDQEVAVSRRGLFGDAWLSCRLSVADGSSPESVLTRGERWCVHVATTLGARP